MQVLVCPKCGMENKTGKASCSGCYASLAGVAETESKQQPTPAATAAPRPRPQPEAQAPAQPLGGGLGSPDGSPAPNYAPPSGAPNTYGPMFNERRQPIKQGPNWGAIFLVILVIAGGGFAGWWFFMKPAGPDKVVQRLIDASKAGDYEKMKACLSQSTINMLQMIPGGEEQAKRAMQSQASRQFDGKITGVTYDDKNNSLAYVALEPLDKRQLPPGLTSIDIVCTKENGQWKVDQQMTGIRMIRKMFPNGMSGGPRFR